MQRLLLIGIAISIAFLFYEEELPPIKVGILHSLTGTMAISEQPVVNATLLAIEQLNANGGLLGRKIVPIIADGKSDGTIFASEAERLITQENVSIIFGCWTSASRKMVKPVVEKYNHLLVYPVQYEGLEQSPNIIYTGAAPNQQIIPAVTWALNTFGARIYLVGSDYVFPRVANWLIQKQTSVLKGSIVGETYLALGSNDVDAMIADIAKIKPDVVINTINGDSNIAFFHAFKAAGLTAETIPILSLSIGEAELATMQDDTRGHYAAWNYFQSIDSQANRSFVDAYQARFGKHAPLSDPMEAAWIGVQLWAKAVQSDQTFHIDAIRQSMRHQSIIAPEGIVSTDTQTQHMWKTARIGKITADRQFDIVWSSQTAIRPDPFPALITQPEADAFLNSLYQGWDQQWAKPTPHRVTP
ncbi:MAG: urea ABC transporter substrate-binding protein [Ghiorsea sp.]